MERATKKVLAIASGGGHWVQLLRLRPAFAGCDITYATVRAGYKQDISDGAFVVVRDCNRSHRLRVLWSAAGILLLLVKLRPDVIVTTGAAIGYFAIRFGRLLGSSYYLGG